MTAATFVLIIFAHVGAMGTGNSNALTTAEFNSRQTCEAAGQAAVRLAQGTVKVIDYACMPK